MSMIKVGWSDYENYIRNVAEKIDKDTFDSILCIGRGGFLLGDAFSRIFKKPLSVIMCKSYKNQTKEELQFSPIASFTKQIEGRLLIVDDMVDSGQTIKKVISFLESIGIQDPKVAVIWKKNNSVIDPDYYLFDIDKDVWIEQPFERLR